MAMRLRKRATKSFDITQLKAALADDKVHVKMGVVTLFDGESSHWELDDGDLFVDVEIAPQGQPVLCRMSTAIGGANLGLWLVPPVGTEVIVAFPDGDFEGNPVIIGCMTSGTAPANLSASIVVLRCPAGGEVRIDDGSGAVPLATLADVQAVASAHSGHTHTGVTTGMGTSGPAGSVSVTGTSVLKGK
jgi:hypothetical protein